MKKIKLLITMFIVIILSSYIISGCRKDDNINKEEEIISNKVEITWWAFPNFETKDGIVGKYEKELADAFMEQNPDIKVNVEMLSYNDGDERINEAIESNSLPDVLYDAPGRIIDYARQGLLVDVDDMIEALNGDVSSAILQGCKFDDIYYMYPFNTTNFTMAANKDMFEEAGLLDLLPLDKVDRQWTIEDLEKALKAIKEARPDVIPLTFFSNSTAGDQGTRAFVANIYGGSVMDEEQTSYTFDSNESIKAVEWVKKSIDEGLIGQGSENLEPDESIDLYLNEEAAITIMYSTGLRNANQSAKPVQFKDVFLPIPAPEGKLQLESLIGGFGIFDNKDESRVEASKKFIDFICNDIDWQEKNLKATGTFSVRDSIKGLYEDEEMKFAESMGKYTAKYYNNVDGFAEMRTYWIETLKEITLGLKVPEIAMEEFNQKANESLKRDKR